MDRLTILVYAGMLAIFLFCVLSGYLRGFIKSILSMIAVVLCIVLAREYCDGVAAWLSTNYVHQALVNAVSEAISKNVTNGAQAIADAIPPVISQSAQLAGFSLTEAAQNAATTANVSAVAEQITAAAEQALLDQLLRIGAFVLIFLVARLAAGILIAVIDGIFHLPVLKSINRSVGGVFGAVKGLLWMLIYVLGLAAVSEFLPETALAEAFRASGLTTVSDALTALI